MAHAREEASRGTVVGMLHDYLLGVVVGCCRQATARAGGVQREMERGRRKRGSSRAVGGHGSLRGSYTEGRPSCIHQILSCVPPPHVTGAVPLCVGTWAIEGTGEEGTAGDARINAYTMEKPMFMHQGASWGLHVRCHATQRGNEWAGERYRKRIRNHRNSSMLISGHSAKSQRDLPPYTPPFYPLPGAGCCS